MGRAFRIYCQAAVDNDGAATLALARRLGIPDRTWRRWCDGPDLVPLLPGAAGVRGSITSRTLLRAHLDALGGGGMLGGRSALWALHGARDDGPCRTPRPLEVVLAHDLRHRRRRGVRVRRCRNLLDDDLIDAHGWPCTSGAFTGMDLVARLDDRAGRALIIDLIFHGLTTARELVARAEATPTALGSKRTIALATPLIRERSDSVFEWMVRRAVEPLGLRVHPGPYKVSTNDGVFEVDVAFPDVQVAIECNGASHLEAKQQARDTRKRNALVLADWLPLEITYGDFVADPEALLATVRRAVTQQRGERRP